MELFNRDSSTKLMDCNAEFHASGQALFFATLSGL
jgi:hypothetical protein